MDQTSLVDEMRRIERRHAGTLANDEQPVDRIRARLREVRGREPDVEVGYSIDDPWELMLLVALCRRYGLRPLRRPRQRSSTVRLLAPKSFMTHTLWPEFLALADALRNHLFRFTDATIREAIYDDATTGGTAPVPATDPTPGKPALRPDLNKQAGAPGTVQQRADEHTTGLAGRLHARRVLRRARNVQRHQLNVATLIRRRTQNAGPFSPLASNSARIPAHSVSVRRARSAKPFTNAAAANRGPRACYPVRLLGDVRDVRSRGGRCESKTTMSSRARCTRPEPLNGYQLSGTVNSEG